MKHLLSVLAILLSFSCFSQFDDEPYQFKKNTIRIGIGSQNASHFPVQYRSTYDAKAPGSRDVEIEYERQINKYFSAGLLYRLVDYDLQRYIYRAHQRQFNLFYAPFNNFRRIQFKLGGGLTHSTVHETNYLEIGSTGSTYARGVYPEWRLTGILELNYNIVKNISIGLKGFSQIAKNNKRPYGGLLKIGYSF